MNHDGDGEDDFVKYDDGNPLPVPWRDLFVQHPVVSKVVPRVELLTRYPALALDVLPELGAVRADAARGESRNISRRRVELDRRSGVAAEAAESPGSLLRWVAGLGLLAALAWWMLGRRS